MTTYLVLGPMPHNSYALIDTTDVTALKQRLLDGSIAWVPAIDDAGKAIDLFVNPTSTPWWYFIEA